jgi:hypothetical protein
VVEVVEHQKLVVMVHQMDQVVLVVEEQTQVLLMDVLVQHVQFSLEVAVVVLRLVQEELEVLAEEQQDTQAMEQLIQEVVVEV